MLASKTPLLSTAEAAARPMVVPKARSIRFSERRLLLASFDAFAINGAFLAGLLWRAEFHLSLRIVIWFVVLTAIWFICSSTLDCYNLMTSAKIGQSLSRTNIAVLATFVIDALLPFISPMLPTSRLDAAVSPVLALVGITAWRSIYATVFVQPNFHQRALVVGAGDAGRTLLHALKALGGTSNGKHGVGYEVLGFVDDDHEIHAQKIEGVAVLGGRSDLVRLVRQTRPDELVLAITHWETIHPDLFASILECREQGVPITTMATVYERLTGRVPIQHVGKTLSVALPLDERASHRFYLVIKRSLDVLTGLAGCVLTAAVIPFIWCANRLFSPGPLFYKQERVGMSGQVFMIFKFRSMVVDAEKGTGAVWADKNDCRVTPVGRFLRLTRLDELPQFWNIFKGEMSLVGPRPERAHFVDRLNSEIPFYRIRHAVRPGLTGWAQIKYRYGASIEDSLAKLQLDLYYIKHQGLLLDAEILFQTIMVVLGLKGR